jgi:flavin reductase (DIM6/NTAB) family NADH-FMN oxidoreductase RutF
MKAKMEREIMIDNFFTFFMFLSSPQYVYFCFSLKSRKVRLIVECCGVAAALSSLSHHPLVITFFVLGPWGI